ncbi:MAG: hypothetical protein IT289_05020 [Oligoflexia bacterium]|nr:hypothetical protein [Oligoflexia bacterium]
MNRSGDRLKGTAPITTTYSSPIIHLELHDRCQSLTESEKYYLESSQYSLDDKMKILNTIIVTLQAHKCAKLIEQLMVQFEDQPLFDYIVHLASRSQRSSADDLLEIAEESLSLQLPTQVPAEEIWSRITQPVEISESEDSIEIKGSVSTPEGDLTITTKVKKAEVPPGPVKAQDVARIVERRKETITFSEGQKPTSFVANPIRSTPKQAAESAVIELERKTLNPKPKESAPPAPSAAPTPQPTPTTPPQDNKKSQRLVFTSEDHSQLDSCDSRGLTSKILKSSKKGKGSEVELLGVKLDSGFESYMKFPASEAETLAAALLPFAYQLFDSPIYWVLSKKSKQAAALANQQNQVEEEKKQIVKIDLLVYKFDDRTRDVKKREFPISGTPNLGVYFEATMKPKDYDKRFTFQLDPRTAYWLRTRIDRIARCMENQVNIAKGASRDSVRSYILSHLVQPSLKPILPE